MHVRLSSCSLWQADFNLATLTAVGPEMGGLNALILINILLALINARMWNKKLTAREDHQFSHVVRRITRKNFAY